MALTAAQLLGATRTASQALAALYIYAAQNQSKVTAWQKGGPTRTILFAVSRVVAPFSSAIDQLANSAFLHTAKKAFLTLLAAEVYGEERRPATFATKTIEVGNTGGGIYAYEAGQLRVINTTRKASYVNQAAVTFTPLAAPIPVAIRAEVPGSGSIALAGEIDAFETPRDGLYIVDETAALAEDEESDDSLVSRCEVKVGRLPLNNQVTAPGGPTSAFESLARSGPDGKGGVARPNGTRITVTRVSVQRTGGSITVYVADEDGPVTAPDLALVDAAILAYGTGIGLSATALNASAVSVPIAGVVFVPNTTTTPDADLVAQAVQGAIAYLERVRIGGAIVPPAVTGVLRREALRAEMAKAVTGAQGVSVDLSAPAADVPLAESEIAVAGSFALTVVRIEGE